MNAQVRIRTTSWRNVCTTCERYMLGAVGITNAILRRDGLPQNIVSERRDTCRECDRASRNPNLMAHPCKGLSIRSRCLECDCFIFAKTRLASEKCPLGKWPAIPRP